jgi:hypothetical protein
MAWVVRRDGARGATFKGVYRDPDGVQRSAGTFPPVGPPNAPPAAKKPKSSTVTGTTPPRGDHLHRLRAHRLAALSARGGLHLAGYQSYLAKHFLPYFGANQIGKIQPVHIQQWVTTAAAGGSPPPASASTT